MRKTQYIAIFLLFIFVAIAGCTSFQVTNTGKNVSNSMTNVGGENLTILSTKPGDMKVIGMIGGVSWVSSAEYYKLMNQMVQEKLGGSHSVKVLMYSVEFGDFSKQERLGDAGNWTPLKEIMIDAAKRLELGGADFIIIGSNTMNSVAPDIEEKVHIPVLNIVDATGKKINESKIKKVALLGTKYTMENGFYSNILEKKYGLMVITPNGTERDYINRVIFDQLCIGDFQNQSKNNILQIINRLASEEGAQGVILGCTELPLLIGQDDVPIPIFDTLKIHAEAAVDYALNGTTTE